ncbi:hypothetical protein [Paenibacillus montanisoli]|uniref:Uncharacterized protein n=1 Tax=Paenibacillus montanisoli TaxID=2081970 RepID=A0A328TZJ3_9BACL|nr:hypothetical protein [Paenibacillus montanisoli]RAP74015.1 hypothetical protein DL346_23350 [Paenibacillus montanisoli]
MRKMKRWKRVALWIATILIVLGASGAFVANYAVNKAIGSLASNLETDLITDLTAEVPTDETSKADTSANASASTEISADASANVSSVGSNHKDANTAMSEKISDKTNSIMDPEQSKGTSQNGGTSVKGDLNGYSPEVSPEKAKKVQGSVTMKEKAAVTSILLSSLSMSDLKKLQKLASGGLSLAEKKEARSIILNKVSPDQYNKLSNIAKKYGVSRGMNYDAVVKEEISSN